MSTKVWGKSRHQKYNREWAKVSKSIRVERPYCQECMKVNKITTEDLQVDHIVPVVEAPERIYDPTNLQVLCRSCHGKKTYKETLGK